MMKPRPERAYFTPEELRRAIVALDIVETEGDASEWGYILREALDAAPSAEPWQNDSAGVEIAGGLLAKRLSQLLGVDLGDCEIAAQVVFSRSRRRAAFDALLSYADELRREPWRPTAAGAAVGAKVPPTVRIVADREPVA